MPIETLLVLGGTIWTGDDGHFNRLTVMATQDQFRSELRTGFKDGTFARGLVTADDDLREIDISADALGSQPVDDVEEKGGKLVMELDRWE
ncbi:hypothetical protein E4U39_001592 [Claviceps sp. Clav50 group G5]|nr:hypothetical protein E4U39_001592 [Claviceps sp. Clav50 group G5]